jgi:hypothetical protein
MMEIHAMEQRLAMLSWDARLEFLRQLVTLLAEAAAEAEEDALRIGYAVIGKTALMERE